jgi:nitrite reductase/ring-hydroxylating ferredoxin subunit
MHRREFCMIMAGVPIAFVAGCATTLRSAPFTVEGGRLALAISALDADGNAFLVGPPLEDVILVRRMSPSEYGAVSMRCTHRGCRVAPAGDRLACPCHGSEFRYTGEVLEGPASEPLRRYPVMVDGNRLLVAAP